MARINRVLQVSDGSVNIVIEVVPTSKPWSLQVVWDGLDSPVKITPKHSNDGANYNTLPSAPDIDTVGAGDTEAIDGLGTTHTHFRVDVDVQSATTGTIVLLLNLPTEVQHFM